jgi:beta-lactamase class A
MHRMEMVALPEPLARAVDRQAGDFSGVLGLWVHDLERRATYGLRAEEPFPAASTIKLFILRELFSQVAAQRVSLDEEVMVRREDLVPGSGVLKDLSPGLCLRLADAAALMITVSDNVATNLLIGRLGTDAINRGTLEAGYADTRLGGLLFRTNGRPATTTAADLGMLMLDIARRRAVSTVAASAMLDILRREQCDDIVGRFLPFSPIDADHQAPRWQVASKNGLLDGVRNDVAYVEGPAARYVVALVSRGCADPRYCVDNEATLCLAGLARAVHDQVSGPA